jgi:hypothetical protein
MLVGPDSDVGGKERVYIGEGDSVLERILAHDRGAHKDFSTQAVFAVASRAC